ncbi:hypothetical protein BFZC1_00020 [Lysinibacillus fusiformis ZC1]|nr:hypothetical protein BFZC1_00020 [Lysinibacillus fusiformis ZC1]
MSKPSLTTRMQLIKQGQAILRTNRVQNAYKSRTKCVQITYKMRTFFRKICAKVLVSEDYVLKKEKILTGYIKGLSYL